ncbi:MAG: flavin reductase family protein [Acidobacteriaceae bacterium]
MHRYDPAEHSYKDIYRLMIGAVVPRPIAFVSSEDKHGVRNLAPFSYFTTCSTNPPVVCFCVAVRGGETPHKDTLRNIRETGEFVVNIVTEEIVVPMNATSAEVGPDVDEFALSGLTPLASELIRPARVAESPFQMECRLRQVVEVSPLPGGGNLVLGEVVLFHIREDLLEDGKIDPDKLRAVGRMGGPTYVRTRERFDLARPK